MYRIIIPLYAWMLAAWLTEVQEVLQGAEQQTGIWLACMFLQLLFIVITKIREPNSGVVDTYIVTEELEISNETTALLGERRIETRKPLATLNLFLLPAAAVHAELLRRDWLIRTDASIKQLIFDGTVVFLATLLCFRLRQLSKFGVLTIFDSKNLFSRLVPFVNALAFLSITRIFAIRDNYTHIFSQRNASPYDKANIFAYYTFWWIKPTLDAANASKSLKLTQIPTLASADEPMSLNKLFKSWWEKNESKITPFKLLLGTGFIIQRRVFLTSFLNGTVFLSCMFIDPILLKELLSRRESFYTSLALVTGLAVSIFESSRVSNNIRTALVQAIFRTTINTSVAKNRNAGGMLTNLIATDTEKLGGFTWGIFALSQWTFSVFSLPFVIYLLHDLVGNGAYIGVGILIASTYFGKFVSSILAVSQRKLQECRDVRSKIMKQVIRSFKVTKLEGLEEMWDLKLREARSKELTQLRIVQYLSAFNSLIAALFGLAIPLSMFSWVVLVDGQELDAATAFSALAWISQMQWSISMLPFLFNAWSSLAPSLERIATYLKTSNQPQPETLNLSCQNLEHKEGEIHLNCVSKGLNVSLAIDAGELVVIIGICGSGKSRLLSSIVTPESTDISCVHGNTALVLQAPFLLNGTVKENILFGLPYDGTKLNEVLEQTDLIADLSSFPMGVMTLVGPSGVQLSGGQKYCFLLDDILSAVDRTTGNRIWNNIITKLKANGKTVVLITHQLHFLSRSEVDRVVLMDNGRVRASGKFADLSHDKHVQKCIEFLFQEDSTSEAMISSSNYRGSNGSQIEKKLEEPILALHEIRNFLGPLMASLQGKLITENLIRDQVLAHFQNPANDDDSMVEVSQKGAVSLSDFRFYLRHFGSLFGSIGALILVSFFSTTVGMFSTVWISIWTDAKSGESGELSQFMYLGIYGILGSMQAILSCIQAIVLALAALKASAKIHNAMVKTLLSAPMSYFDTHSSDLGSVDSSVPNTIMDQITKTFSITSQFLLIIFFTPFVMLILPFVIMFYIFVIKTFRIAARDTRRIESVARSPVYDLFSDVLNGLETIQCFGAQDRFERWNQELVGKMAAAKIGNEAVNKWAQALTVQASCLFYFFAGFVGVILMYRNVISVSTFGLILLNAAVLQRALMDFVMGLTNLETNFVSVERVAEFAKMRGKSDNRDLLIPSTWPQNSLLQIENLRLRYSINRHHILKGISLSIEHGDKVAVIGRTGCGKSSLLAALAQLYPPSDGKILIDGINVTKIPPESLRNILRVIPQETVLFDGTIRENILLGREIDDAQIWATLEMVQIKDRVVALGGLDAEISFGGTDFSAGERQLLCLGRALALGIPKILLCDEVTSNVDLATDDLILQSLLSLTSSVVMVMHRLESLRRFDKILMLHQGKIVAYGDAKALIDGNPDIQQFLQQNPDHA
ncbi:hypothetical protein HK100_012631 [Physocladia obscura]|uniref:ATP-binding cassette transporter n=1 Tax=Physocladia obscura TaxID=109957 RepID=A0AAD5T2A5_9FUNG|nr:hypothetical protein HK100_012631 [Physocladia obscura]